MKPYFVYFARCADQTLYTGICTDVKRRIKEHNSASQGARYTHSRQPVVLAYQESCLDRSTALKREHALRHLSRSEKEALCTAAYGSLMPIS